MRDAPVVPAPHDDAERCRALDELRVLDSEPEEEFDALVRAAALVCDVPISLISLVDARRQWFKANTGLPGVTETPRELAFCAHALQQAGVFEIPDAERDPRFAENPLVTGDPSIRFYAGAPLCLSNGACVGTLCVIDRKPRRLDATQRQVLEQLAIAAVRGLERRMAARAYVEANAALAQQRQRLASIIEGTAAGTWEWNRQTGELLINEQWAAIIGSSLAELQPITTQSRAQLVHPEDVGRTQSAMDRHLAGETYRYECEVRLRHREGRWVWVLDRGRVLSWTHDGKPEWVFGTLIDVTDRKMREQALHNSEQLLNRTGAVAGVGGWEIDLLTGVISWSLQTCRIHGVEEGYRPQFAEAINYYAPESRPLIQAAVERAMQHGEGWDLELPFIQADGNRIWVRAVGSAEFEDGKPVRLLGAFQDITERVGQRHALEEAHQRLEEAHQRVSLATDSGRIGIWDYDVAEATLRWDAWMYRLYDEAASSTSEPYELWTRHLHPEDRAEVEQCVSDALEGRTEYDTEFRIVWRDGTVRYIRAAGKVTRDATGKALRMTGVNWDVTRLRELSAELEEQHELLRVTFQSIGDGVITTDPAGAVRWMNPVAERITGWCLAEAAGRPLESVFRLVGEQSGAVAPNPVAACLKEGRVVGLAHHAVLVSRDGREYGLEDSAAPIRTERGAVLGAVLVFRDVTEQRRLAGEMTRRATQDALTGLINRGEFEARLQRALHKSHEDQRQHGLLFLDLDQFKLVNDSCGHAVGDLLLQQVSKLLVEAVRGSDSVARLGGDEFAILLENCPAEHAERIANKLCETIDRYRLVHDGRSFRIGASVGLVGVDSRWASTSAVMQVADASCYAAKEAGRNRVHVWHETDSSIHARNREVRWATRLSQALDERRFVLFAQRVVPLAEGALGLHAEALIRLVDEEGQIVVAGAFLPAAERFHMSSRIDRWVLQHATEQLLGHPQLASIDTLCVNLSGQSIGDRAFHHDAMAILRGAGEAVRRCLCLEITETAAITNMADAASFMSQVRALGVRVALDDFGAGASSFGYLRSLPVDLLKIDGQFIKDIVEDPLNDAATRCFVEVARVLGIKTVAEFVDRPEVLERVRVIGVDYAQGFLLHKPEPLEQVLSAWPASSLREAQRRV